MIVITPKGNYSHVKQVIKSKTCNTTIIRGGGRWRGVHTILPKLPPLLCLRVLYAKRQLPKVSTDLDTGRVCMHGADCCHANPGGKIVTRKEKTVFDRDTSREGSAVRNTSAIFISVWPSTLHSARHFNVRSRTVEERKIARLDLA
jgi:hypothetical protein